ncbi:hypothetical protein Pth03_21690 [Planotetraspora thailandica]|uniref:DUF4115 domain-containing protein n=1 Tax=Planotetraspora thailandica TaxID=487172 RepID=A0A8J3XV82_9ACTN|nr:hypothetical protein [Planotetraspora thailandica]GII53780.1 hypothetical protein Pth03_21690 [Planotetraspora thailandica]
MGRHRSDPLGIARLALAGLAVIVLLALIGVGARALFSSLDSSSAPVPDTPSAPASPSSEPATPPEKVPTVQLVCQADLCPVFVRVPGGDVLIDRDMTRGEQASYSNPELDVVLDDAGTVRVYENGTPREQGAQGERQEFMVKRDQGR